MSRQMRELNARIRNSSSENSSDKQGVTADQAHRYLNSFLTAVGFVVGVALIIGQIAIAGYIAWRFFIPVLSDRLNLPVALSTVLLIASSIHLEGYSSSRKFYWQRGLQSLNLPLFRINRKTYLGINAVGGVMPVAIALYQLTRVPLLPALLVTMLVVVMSYFSARVVPTTCIFLKRHQMWAIAFATALISTIIMSAALQPLSVSIAFTGCVIGSLIGVDLLHLKDLQLKKASHPVSIGGAGLKDGLLTLGLMSLLISEYFPKFIGWLDSRVPMTVHYPLVAALVGTGLGGLMLHGCYKTYLWTLSQGASASNRPLYLSKLGAGYVRKGRYKKAEKLYKQAIALSPLLSTEDYLHKITTLVRLAVLYTQQDRLAEAELTYQQALPLAKKHATYNPNEVIVILFGIAQLCEQQQRYNEARRLYAEALSWIDRFMRASIAVDNAAAIAKEITTRLTSMVIVT